MSKSDIRPAYSNSMLNYLEKTGRNYRDEKSKAAYERFKRPPYYLTCNKKIKNKEKEN